MNLECESLAGLSHEQKALFVMDLLHRTMMHHAIWYNEVHHQFGERKALELLRQASQRSFDIQLSHLSQTLGFGLTGGIPDPLLELDEEKLEELKSRLAKNWLVNDGVWFQTVESAEGMNDAKRCNDSCWARFSPVEASMISSLLGLKDMPGLEGLKRALAFRVYAEINTQSIIDESQESFIFQMNECRVQAARKRKGLDDYPCKSAGLVEYKFFARAIDPRIRTECIGCPPDEHPEDWFCAWRFTLKTNEND